MNKYAAAEQKKRLKVIVTEYCSIDWAGHWKGINDMGYAIVTFDMAGQLLLPPQIEVSCFGIRDGSRTSQNPAQIMIHWVKTAIFIPRSCTTHLGKFFRQANAENRNNDTNNFVCQL